MQQVKKEETICLDRKQQKQGLETKENINREERKE
jgi:hypothetical protein